MNHSVVLSGCISDALGVPFESFTPDNPLLAQWDNKSFLGSKYHGLKPFEYSDDGQMLYMVSQSLTENKSFNPDDLAARYVDWIVSGRARGYGKSTLLAINNLQSGVHWSQSGAPNSWGNGSSMRAAPYGVFFRNSLKDLIDAVKIDSAITHKSNEAEAGALAVALAVYFIVNKNEDDLLKKIDIYLPESEVKNKLKNLMDMVNSEFPHQEVFKILGTRADVRQTVPSALYAYFKFKTMEEGVVAAIRAGHDSDTTACISGSLFGAKYGIEGIPKDWIEQIENRDELIALDHALYSHDG